MRYFQSKTSKQEGFTIIEMMVSVTIFTTVLAVSISSLLALVNANKKAQTLRVAIDNLDLVMEDMTRSIAQARSYHCDVTIGTLANERNCPNGADSIYVQSNDTAIASIQYSLQTNGQGEAYISKTVQPESGGSDVSEMTNPEVITITHLDFRVYGAEIDGSKRQPRVVISIGGKAGEGERATAFNVQTTVTQRVPQVTEI